MNLASFVAGDEVLSGVWAKISEQKLQKVAINLFREGEEEMEVERCYLLHNDPLHSSSFKQDRRREGRKEGRKEGGY